MATDLITHSDGARLKFAESERCRAHSKRSHNRCKRAAMPGLKVCFHHGGNAPQCRSKAERVLAMENLKALVRPISAVDPEANPIHAFELEFRRTVAAIRYLDSVVASLDPSALGWGVASEKQVGSGEYPGTDTERKAQANVYYTMRMAERKHLVDLVKVWIGAKLDVRKLEVEEQKIEALNSVIEIVLTKLGHDVKDPAVRGLVHDTMLRLPTAADTYDVTAKQIAEKTTSLVSVAEREARQKQRGRVGRG